jgi:hypothetical protein
VELTTKPDLEKCLARVEAWWDGAIIDRPPVTMWVKPAKPERAIPAHHASIRDRWLDIEYNIDRVEAWVDSTVFLAESFPKHHPNLGPELCAATYGAELTFNDYSSWSVPVAGSIRDVLKLRPNLDTFYWNTIRRMTDMSVQRGRGKWITGVADLHVNGDLLASLRDPQHLAMDFMDDLEGVKLACQHVRPEMMTFFHDLWRRIAPTCPVCSTWGVVVAPKATMYYISCDFICMISPAMFAGTILPLLEWEIGQFGRSIFHLDGPRALVHLDALLATKLHAIQWVYGAGATRAADWIEVYRKIQNAGKSIEVHAADLADARVIMENLRPEGIWLAIGGQYALDEAQAFLKETERWAAKKR